MGKWMAARAQAPRCLPKPGGGLPVSEPRSRAGSPRGGPRRVTPWWAPCPTRAPPFTPTRVPAKPARRGREPHGGLGGGPRGPARDGWAEGCRGCGWLFGWAGRVWSWPFSRPSAPSSALKTRVPGAAGFLLCAGLAVPALTAAEEAGFSWSRGGRGLGCLCWGLAFWGAGHAPVPGLARHPRVLGAPLPAGPGPLSACLPSSSSGSYPLCGAQRPLPTSSKSEAQRTGNGYPVLDIPIKHQFQVGN